MATVMIVDDYEDWRSRIRQLLQNKPELQAICEVSDGLTTVEKAAELNPDLIILDVGLPKLNGIEVARQIGQFSPKLQDNYLEPRQVLRDRPGSFEHGRGLHLQAGRQT